MITIAVQNSECLPLKMYNFVLRYNEFHRSASGVCAAASGYYKWLSMCFGTPYGILSFTNICKNTITAIILKQINDTVFGFI